MTPIPMVPIPVAPIAVSMDEPVPSAEAATLLARPLRRRAPPVAVGWLVTMLILVEFAYLVQAHPGPIIHAWPAAQHAYALFGVQPTP